MVKKSLSAVLLIALIAFVVIVTILFVGNKSISGFFLGMKKQTTSTDVPEVAINYGNMESVMSKSSIVSDIPENAEVLLRFYNFNSGQREWEKSYILKKGEVKEGYTESADITAVISSKYLNGLTTKNFCNVIQQAKENGDFGTELKISEAKFLWEYRGMLKYRECLGF